MDLACSQRVRVVSHKGLLPMAFSKRGARNMDADNRSASPRKDVYVVRSAHAPRGAADTMRFGVTENARLPGGKMIHSMDRATFDRAVKAAMKDINAK